MRIKVHTQGIKGSGTVKPGEEPGILFNGILEIDGELIDEVTEIAATFRGGEIASVKATFLPGAFEVVSHDNESWPELLNALREMKETPRDGAGTALLSD